MASIKQHADGSLSFYSELEGVSSGRVGGVAIGSASAPKHRVPQIAVFAFTGAAETGGGVFAWQPEDTSRIHVISKVILRVTTAATSAGTMDVGIGTSATTLYDTLIDGLDVNTATGIFDNITNKGTNGLPTRNLAAGSYITASAASGAVAGMVGVAYIEYWPI